MPIGLMGVAHCSKTNQNMPQRIFAIYIIYNTGRGLDCRRALTNSMTYFQGIQRSHPLIIHMCRTSSDVYECQLEDCSNFECQSLKKINNVIRWKEI